MENILETVSFFEKAESTLHELCKKVGPDADVQPRHYISVLKECLAAIKALQVWYCLCNDI